MALVACGMERSEVETGRALYAQQCRVCHGDASTGVGGVPKAPVHGIDGHTWHHADGQLEQIILGQFEYPGRTMPPFEGILSDEDVDAVLTYLKASWLSEQRASQAEASRNWDLLQGSPP